MSESITIKPGSSMERVVRDAEARQLAIELRVMAHSTRTAEDAAAACGCEVGQIIKSLVFTDQDDRLVLLLVSGRHNVDLSYLTESYGMFLNRCDGRRVRDETGFAIGGVAPIGHLKPIRVYWDAALDEYETVWAAAGRPDAVFRCKTHALKTVLDPSPIQVRQHV